MREIVDRELSTILFWLKQIATNGYILREDATYIVKKHGGGADIGVLPERVFNYFQQEGYLQLEGPEGQPHYAYFLTATGKAAADAIVDS
jgi:hypothetical protein